MIQSGEKVSKKGGVSMELLKALNIFYCIECAEHAYPVLMQWLENMFIILYCVAISLFIYGATRK